MIRKSNYSPRILAAALTLAGFPSTGNAKSPTQEKLQDFDHDGVPEKLVRSPEGTTIFQRNADGEWTPADFSLPDGIHLLDIQLQDTGLRFVDLNGDGFDDILFSNPSRFAIYLWTKQARPELGWTRGWSQLVKEGPRTGAAGEPPSLVGAKVTIADGILTITRPPAAPGASPPPEEHLVAKQLIAFDMPPPKSPADALTSFHTRPGFRVELVASEPQVVDPVGFDWDAQGRLWVVEMRDYPQGMDGKGQPGGAVKMLTDADGDGLYEKATVFLDGLAFPSSLTPWRKGVLITAAPDLIYAEDTDGDGRADVKKVLFTGFEPGNQQHRFNGFERGLDGWIYLANGDSGGTVKSLATGQEVSISGRDIRLRPDTGEIETVSSASQFGLRRDDWGNWFGNNNATWLWHVTLPEHYLRRNPKLAVKSVREVLANYDDSTRVFPVSAPMERLNQPWALNHVTSGCSPTPYRDELFGPDFATSIFICEPVHNAVHREVLEHADSGGFTSHRAAGEESSEFLASTDPWFRPVALKTGPDGALYVADMYRFVLEHPEWIAPEMQARLNLRAGEDKGRIYRIVPEGVKNRRPIPNLATLKTPNLAAAMDSPNGWQRDMVMELLLQRGDATAAVDALHGLLALNHAPAVRLQALATLGRLGKLTPEILATSLADPHPGVRCAALRESEVFSAGISGRTSQTGPTSPTAPAPTSSHQSLWQAIAALADDSQPEVRLQAAFSLGAWPPGLNEPVLRRLTERLEPNTVANPSPNAAPDRGELFRTAIQSSQRPDSELFAQLQSSTPLPRPADATVSLKPSSADRAAVIAEYAGVAKLTGDPARGQAHFQQLCATCHRLRGEGHEVGPDLGMVGSKPADWLLTAILDPNQNVEARYRAWILTLKSGETLSGLISAETTNNLVFRLPGGTELPVLRTDIQKQEPLPVSLMPAGFESALKPQDLADLLRWLHGP